MKRSALVGLWLIGAPLAAQEAGVRSFVDRTSVPMGQRFVLSVQITGDNQQIGDPVVPDLSAFARFLGSGSSQQISIVNGRTTVSRTLQYTFLTTAEGTFTIPSVAVEIAGTSHRTDPVPIEVGAPTAGGAPGGDAQTGVTGVTADDLFVRATVNRRTAYPNQTVIVEYRIYTRVNVRQYNVEPPSTAGFFVEEFPLPASPVTESEVIEGRRYVVATIRKMALFPTSVGTRTIEPMRVTTGIEVRNQSRDPFDSFFNLGSMLGRVVEYDVYSNPVTIEVKPFPDGAPDGFTGLVGTLSMDAWVDSTAVERDNAITLRLRVRGSGNLKMLPAPEIDFPSDFEVYPPDVVESGDWEGNRVTGSRTYEYVLIPRSPGRKTIPSVQMAFFDDQLNTYRTVRTAPIEIAVTGDPVSGPLVSTSARRSVRALRDDVRFIHTDVPRFTPIGRSGFGGPKFWTVLLVPLVLVGGAAVARRQRDRLEGDRAYARRRRSSTRARKRLRRARAAVSPSDQVGFFTETEKALEGFLGDRLNVSEAGFIRDEVIEELRARGVDPGAIEEYFDCIDLCAARRFAPGQATVEEMHGLLDRAEAAMADLERGTV